MVKWYITNSFHGGKETCHKCGSFMFEGEATNFTDVDTGDTAWFCNEHYNKYEHYYGLDKPID